MADEKTFLSVEVPQLSDFIGKTLEFIRMKDNKIQFWFKDYDVIIFSYPHVEARCPNCVGDE